MRAHIALVALMLFAACTSAASREERPSPLDVIATVDGASLPDMDTGADAAGVVDDVADALEPAETAADAPIADQSATDATVAEAEASCLPADCASADAACVDADCGCLEPGCGTGDDACMPADATTAVCTSAIDCGDCSACTLDECDPTSGCVHREQLGQVTYGEKHVTSLFGLADLGDGFALVGQTNEWDKPNTRGLLIRTDPTGKPLWQKTYGSSSLDEFRRVLALTGS